MPRLLGVLVRFDGPHGVTSVFIFDISSTMFDFLSGSENARTKMLKLVDTRSILRLREVSKTSRDLVDMSLLSRRETTVLNFLVRHNLRNLALQNDRPKIELTFTVSDLETCNLWIIGLQYLTKMLEIESFAVPNYRSNDLCANMTIGEAACFLECLKPLIENAPIHEVQLYYCSHKIVEICFNFLQGKRFELSMSCLNFENHFFSTILQMIKLREIKYFQVYVRKLGNVDFFKWLVKLSEVVEKHSTSFGRVDGTPNLPKIIRNLVNALSKTKCKQFEISVYENGPCAKLIEVEQLLQDLHKSDKKILVRLPFDQVPIHAQIGVYTLEPLSPYLRTLTIRHMEYNEFED